MAPDGPAALSEEIYIGDVIVWVNGKYTAQSELHLLNFSICQILTNWSVFGFYDLSSGHDVQTLDAEAMAQFMLVCWSIIECTQSTIALLGADFLIPILHIEH